jgi:arginase
LFSPQALRQAPAQVLCHFPLVVQSVYLHVDLDVIDPSYGRANTFATPGGIYLEELLEMLRRIKQRYTIAAIAFTAYDPSLDPDFKLVLAVKQLLDSILHV